MEIDLIAQGIWQELPNGDQQCKYRIRSRGALMISVQFDRWLLPKGGVVHIYIEDNTRSLSVFTASDRDPVTGTLATFV